MRRVVLICLMLVLPLQWSWAAAAQTCLHEADVSVHHFGHHTHTHKASLEAFAAGASDPVGDFAMSTLDNDCSTCHAIGMSLVLTSGAALQNWDRGYSRSPYERIMADRIPDLLLRPPLYVLA